MILFLHNRYRVSGGEERVVEDQTWLVREHLGEEAQVLERDSAAVGRRAAALGLLRGGLDPQDVAKAVRLTGARVVHAHNLHPTLGWRALAAAQAAGARTVLQLHNYRLICAVGTCVNPAGEDCTRCHGRRTLPGVRLNCRGSRAEALTYAAGLSLQQHRLIDHADTIVVPSHAARTRLTTLGAPRRVTEATVLGHVIRDFAEPPEPHAPAELRAGEAAPAAVPPRAIVASRLAREKGVDLAIEACARAGVPLTVCGDGPLGDELRAQAAALGADVTFTGRVGADELARLRAGATVAVVPSRAQETFGLAALEALAAGLPVIATRVGALADLDGDVTLVPRDDAEVLAQALRNAPPPDPARAIAAARRRAAPEVIAPRLAELYA
ncbi:glycosyltransferase [Conexibacter woesei]|uniref:glycosyltransferase n=1 Tax=Conexibacter woesei TaxID=191495 RepID=UPI00047E6A14|nr:glycosyltransferase [Conexibacter woesei]